MEPLWLKHAKRLQAIASSGVHFTRDVFDRERYEEIAAIANDMLAQLGNVPIERIESLVSDFARGYATPKVDVRGAVIEGDAVLLVRERSDGLWTLPGGFADVGLSASRNVVKEIHEEAGISVEVRRLFSVRHKAIGAYPADVRDFYKMFFLCDRVDGLEPLPGVETMDARFFQRHLLPPLSRGRTVEGDIEAAFDVSANPQLATLFD